MEKVIIIGPKEKISTHVDLVVAKISSFAKEVLLIDPKETPNYKEKLQGIKDSLVITLDDSGQNILGKELENKILELKKYDIDDIKPLDKIVIDNKPRYDRFLKKGKRENHRPKPKINKKF